MAGRLVSLLRLGQATDETLLAVHLGLSEAGAAAELQLRDGEREAVDAAIVFSVQDLCNLARYRKSDIHSFRDIWTVWLAAVPEEMWLTFSFGFRPGAAAVAASTYYLSTDGWRRALTIAPDDAVDG